MICSRSALQGGCVEALLEWVLRAGDLQELALKGMVQLSLSKETRVDMYNVIFPDEYPECDMQ